MAKLSREELERDLVRRDKQALISDALKLFDSNKVLQGIIEGQVEKIRILEAEKTTLSVEVERLDSRRWVQVLNEHIKSKIERIRGRRKARKNRFK